MEGVEEDGKRSGQTEIKEVGDGIKEDDQKQEECVGERDCEKEKN